MTADTLINFSVPFIKPTDSVKWALEQLSHFKMSHLPVVSGKAYLGMISEDSIIDENPSKKISSLPLDFKNIVLAENEHYFEILKIYNANHINILAVVNENGEFVGVVNAEKVLEYFSNIGFINTPGGIIVLSVPQTNYSPAEIHRILESNEHRAIFMYVSDLVEDTMNVYVTLKLNKTDLTRIVAALERYGYNVVAVYHESLVQDIATERLNHLLKYLSV
ncbi:MAG: CBS domain-containing protein [Cytophagales bacterium]|nr:CBS domain-containing protein [Cytophagales bacterium]